MSNDLNRAIAEMNALPDISDRDSDRLRGFMRVTATEIKAVGGVGAATSLEMIGYIRELEHKLARVDPPAAPTAKWDKAGLKEACQRALKLGRTHQEMDIQLVLDMLLEIERLEASTSNG